jgi:hypothetical protein
VTRKYLAPKNPMVFSYRLDMEGVALFGRGTDRGPGPMHCRVMALRCR